MRVRRHFCLDCTLEGCSCEGASGVVFTSPASVLLMLMTNLCRGRHILSTEQTACDSRWPALGNARLNSGVATLEKNVCLCLCCYFCGEISVLFALPQKAKKKKIAKMKAADLGVDTAPHFDVVEVTDPPTREAGIKVEDVDTLIAKLKDAGRI